MRSCPQNWSRPAIRPRRTGGGDQETVIRLLEATKKAYVEGREGLGAKLENLRRRKEDLEAQKALIGQKLSGEEPS